MDARRLRPAALAALWILVAQTGGALSASAEMSRQELGVVLENKTQQLRGVPYNGRIAAPGDGKPWVMDCSNTSRWLYLQATGLTLPRTASAQYESLRAQRRLWLVQASDSRWQTRLRPGDLLFWEHTYRPKRNPPITHVMVYLGRNPDGSMRMAGSQNSRGVNIYTFRPEAKNGGYNWFLWFKRSGRFVAFGRPL